MADKEQLILEELKAIRGLLTPTPFEAKVRRLERTKLKPYQLITKDLGIARTDEGIVIEGDTLVVSELDGEVKVRFNEPDADQFTLTLNDIYEGIFYKLFLTNTAQSDRAVTLVVGKAGAFRLEPGGGTDTPRVLGHGAQTTNAATAVVLASDTPCREVLVTAKPANTGYVYVGGSAVSGTSYGKRLSAGESLAVSVNNLSKVYIDVSVSTEGVDYLYVA